MPKQGQEKYLYSMIYNSKKSYNPKKCFIILLCYFCINYFLNGIKILKIDFKLIHMFSSCIMNVTTVVPWQVPWRV